MVDKSKPVLTLTVGAFEPFTPFMTDIYLPQFVKENGMVCVVRRNDAYHVLSCTYMRVDNVLHVANLEAQPVKPSDTSTVTAYRSGECVPEGFSPDERCEDTSERFAADMIRVAQNVLLNRPYFEALRVLASTHVVVPPLEIYI